MEVAWDKKRKEEEASGSAELPGTGKASIEARKKKFFEDNFKPPVYNWASYGHWDNCNDFRKWLNKVFLRRIFYGYVGAR